MPWLPETSLVIVRKKLWMPLTCGSDLAATQWRWAGLLERERGEGKARSAGPSGQDARPTRGRKGKGASWATGERRKGEGEKWRAVPSGQTGRSCYWPCGWGRRRPGVEEMSGLLGQNHGERALCHPV